MKDLPDIPLLASARSLNALRVRAALEQTFTFRNTHPLPVEFPNPPPSWATPYAVMARDDRLPWSTIEEVTSAARAFIVPVLVGGLEGTWTPETWAWCRP